MTTSLSLATALGALAPLALLISSPSPVSASPAPAPIGGTVWVVDDDGGADVDATDPQAAADAAEEGDTLLLRSGNYGALEVNGKSLVIVAEGDVLLDGAQLWIHDLGPDQSLVVRGVDVVGPTAGTLAAQVPLRLTANQGRIWLEDCEFRHVTPDSPGFPALTAAPGGSITTSAAVTIVSCEFRGREQVYYGSLFTWTISGLLVEQSTVVIHDSLLDGSDGAGGHSCFGACPGSQGGPGLSVYDSFAFVSGSTLRGGQGLPGGDGTSILNCGQGGTGGHALQLIGGPQTNATLVDTVLEPGEAGPGGSHPSGFTCSDGGSGQSIVNLSAGGSTPLPGTHRRATIDASTEETELATLEVTGQPGDYVFVFVSGSQNSNLLLDLASMVGIAPPQFLLISAPVDETGSVQFPVFAPSLPGPPGPESLTIYFQVGHLTPGLTFSLGNPTVWTVLDVPIPPE